MSEHKFQWSKSGDDIIQKIQKRKASIHEYEYYITLEYF
jgi:hypothetical protein